MKGFKLNLFLFIIWWPIFISTIDEIDIHSTLELQTTHHETIITEIDLNKHENVINMTSDTVDYSQDFLYTEDVQKICQGQVNEFVWKCPTTTDSEEKHLKFRTMHDPIGYATSHWYLKSINGIDIVEIYLENYGSHQIEFKVYIYEHKISLSRLYPTYPEISGFEILQFITNLAFQCELLLHIYDLSDLSTVYSTLYGKNYYEYHLKDIDLSQKFLFEKIVVKKKTFLDCFEKKIRYLIEVLSEFFCGNIQVCEKTFVSVECCPIDLDTHRIFYKTSFNDCIDWSPIGGYPEITLPISQLFEITSGDMTRIMNKKKQSNMNFVKINHASDEKIIKTYDEIKTQIFDTSLLMKLFSNIFQLCFFELEIIKSDPNPEDIFKLYLRPCVIPNINLFLKYHTNI